jgi:hypothetical protein
MTQKPFLSRGPFLSAQECEYVRKYILATEALVKASGPDIYEGTAEDSLTGRYKTHNYLNTELGELLIPRLRAFFREIGFPGASDTKRVVAVQCWANIFRKGEGIDRHRHNDGTCAPYLSANLFISGPTDVGTTYELEDGVHTIPNKVGELSVFSDFIYHGVNKNPYETPRITMAMDFHVNTFVAPRYFNVDPDEENRS